MPLEQTVTIINNSGKIISTGKQLASIFKEAKASYQEKKAQIKTERSLQRAQTFTPPRTIKQYEEYQGESDEEGHYSHGHHHSRSKSRHLEYEDAHQEPRRRSHDYAQSVASSRRSHRHHHKSSHSSRSHHGEGSSKSRTMALTSKNLKTHSEASSTKPSKPPMQYRSPYAETLPRGQSHMDLTTLGVNKRDSQMQMVPRRRSESELRRLNKAKEIDMNLAYGDVPPDLAFRTDLDPMRQTDTAKGLVSKIEGLLEEAQCVQHSATSMIKHLQERPESAAAVALTLSELSKVVAKMSPAILGMLQGNSPAVFSLLASPQFLIGTGVAVGLTVVMFGGWKIVKQVKEQREAREAMAYQGVPMSRPAPLRTQSAYAASFDEALVLDDELSVIESWRRGIEPLGDDASAEIELITPEADRATRADGMELRDDDFDVQSRRSMKTHRTSKTAKTSKTHKTSKTTRTNKTEKMHKTHKAKLSDDEEDKRSNRGGASSVRGVPRSEIVRSSSSHHGKDRDGRAIESRRARDDMDLVMRPKVRRQDTDMLKSLFKSKKEKDSGSRSIKELVLA